MLLDLFMSMLDSVNDLGNSLLATYLAYKIGEWWKDRDADDDSES